MNKTLNQLINRLHLDPKKEAAVRKIVENVGSHKEVSCGSAPVIIELDSQDFSNNGYNCSASEIQAILNYNVLFKMTNLGINGITTFVLRPYSYVESEEGLIIGVFIEININSTRAAYLLKDNKLTVIG